MLAAEQKQARAVLPDPAASGRLDERAQMATNGQSRRVTAVDFSTAALTHARSMAESAGADVARRVDWVEADLASWTPTAASLRLAWW
jgi:hypothetical protein